MTATLDASVIRQLRRRLAPLSAPGLVPWIAALGTALIAALVAPSPAGRASLPPLFATALLMLATGRTWAVRRAASERIGLAIAPALCVLLLARLPAPFTLALLPPFSLGAILAVLAAGAWRFAPDHGQQGQFWIIRSAITQCLGPAFGLALFLAPALWLIDSSPTGLAPAALTALGAVLGHVFAGLLSPGMAATMRANNARAVAPP